MLGAIEPGLGLNNIITFYLLLCAGIGNTWTSRFLTPVDVNPIKNAESDHFVPPENWSNLSDAAAFEEFVQCDSELATCSLLTNEETSSEEEDNCNDKPLPSFQQALAGFNTMQEYLISSDLNDKVKIALLTVHNKRFSVHSKKFYNLK
ncbi:hypothetical protein AVEN_230756-1 [Araneus ventricosus]|uniref:Centromere protein CENP-B C-terminal domain-containing protein n=1 Tax=Araneus ventricosus TaxID=182803 RepID=A0A4Y2A267_ARAVE|nr:hypothetical protein AVEN_230756-1 [Araneus ventricosus]